jgi:hypothetical protein
MENFGEELDKEEFIESSIALLEKVDIIYKNAVFNYGKKVEKTNDFMFKPNISEGSK